jgi:hypothetical protein
VALTGLWSRLTSGIVGLGIGGAAARAFEPIFELLRQESWDANPYRVLGVQQLAELVANAVVPFDVAAGEAQRAGYQSNRLRALVELSLNAPTIGAAQDMRRRDAITPEQFRHALRKAGLEPQYDEAAFALLDVLPTVQDLVRMAVREVFSPGQRTALDLDAEFPDAFAARARELGLSRETAGEYWAAHWELPSYEQLAEMRFRGLLSAGEFRDALKAIDYAPTWRDKLEEIARRIPQITDMVRFAVREVYDPQVRQALGIDAEYPDAFTPQAALHGMTEEHARQYWAAHWRLPSARQGYQMVWRGEMEPPELRTLLKALDYPPKWRDRLFNIAFIVPGRIDLKRMLRHGILDRGALVEGYKRIGYAPADAELMTQIAEAEVGAGGAAETYVGKARTALFNRVHTEYVSRQLTPEEASSGLAVAGVPEAERVRVVSLWTREADLIRTELTQAQVVKAYWKGLYTIEQATAELAERGVAAADIPTRIEIGKPAS